MSDFKHQANWLIISHAFNMDGRAASQTITDKIPFLIQKGIRPIVVSGVLGRQDPLLEHYRVLPAGPSGLRFDLRHALKRATPSRFIYRTFLLILGVFLLPLILLERTVFGLQSHASWAITAYLKSRTIVKNNKIQIIYSTGGAYSAHYAALLLKRTTGVKWICELHDPLVSPAHQKSDRNSRFMRRLESAIASNADLVWWFTQGAYSSALQRNPNLYKNGLSIVPGANPPEARFSYKKGIKIHIAHFGSLSQDRNLVQFSTALKKLIKKNPEYKQLISLDVFGTSLDKRSQAFITKEGLNDVVEVHGRLEYCPRTKRSGREQVSEKMQMADILLLIHGTGPGCSEYIPSKVYEYSWINRPTFCISYENSELDQFVLDRGGFVADSQNPEEIELQLTRIIQLWQADVLGSNIRLLPISTELAVETLLRELKTRNVL